MINTNTLARPYAKAAFEFASAAQQADAWLNMLSLSAAAVQTSAVAQQLVNPALTDEQKSMYWRRSVPATSTLRSATSCARWVATTDCRCCRWYANNSPC